MKLKMSTSYHSEIDEQSKVVNRYLRAYQRCLTLDKPNSWKEWLYWVEYYSNISFHSSFKTIPFNVIYGYDPPTIIQYDIPPLPLSIVDQ